MNETLKKKLIERSMALAIAAGASSGAYYVATDGVTQKPSAAVVLAQEIGYHFESSGRHIGTPYIDHVGKGKPWTVCAGITGPEVKPNRYYTPEDCRKLELPRYIAAEKAAKKALKHWESYNPYVQASFIDMGFNVPSALAPTTTIMTLANAGKLDQACAQMTRWVYGTSNGQSVRLNGLVDRRETTEELCAQWGRSGHFSAGLLGRAAKPLL